MNQPTLAMTAMFPIYGEMPTQDFRFNFNVFSAMRQVLRSRAQAMPVTIPITVMGRADFIHHVTLHLPEVSALIEEDDFGVLHLEMGAMKLATQCAILRYEFYTVRRHFAFISYLFEHADKALYDAILVSYLESLFIGESTAEYESARGLLSANMREALKRAELRYQLLDWQAAKY
jgi:hypothetical protein